MCAGWAGKGLWRRGLKVMVMDDGWCTMRVSSVVEAEGKRKCNKEEVRRKGSRKVRKEQRRKEKKKRGGKKSGSGVGKETKKGIFLNISVVTEERVFFIR